MNRHMQKKKASARIISICALASRRGLLDGWSGNASLRLAGFRMLITASGSPKGMLKEKDCLVLDSGGNVLSGCGKPSSEFRMHQIFYREIASCDAILHSHPVNLQALELVLGEKGNLRQEILSMDLFEAKIWGKRLFMAPAGQPGSAELAHYALKALEQTAPLPCAVWLQSHGLAALAKNLTDALCLSEELEHLARVRLKFLGASRA